MCLFTFFYFYFPACWLMWEPKWLIFGRRLVVSSMKILYKHLPFELCSFLFKPKCGITVNRNTLFHSCHCCSSSICFFCTILVFRGAQCEVFQSVAIGWGQGWAGVCHTMAYIGRHRWILKVCSGRYSHKPHFSDYLGMLLLSISALCNRWYGKVPSFVSTWKKILFLY